MSLAAFQDAFSKLLLAPTISDGEVEGIPYLPPSPTLTKQFKVYRKQFLSGLHSVLASAYPTVKNVIGNIAFKSASDDYFMLHPPQNVDPILICEEFSAYIEGLEINHQWPYLADLATIDLGCFQSKQAIDASAVNKSIFTALPPEQLASHKIQLHPSCFWISSPYAIYDIWQKHNSNTESADIQIDTPQELVILRSTPNIRVYKANPGLVKTLDALDSGEPLNTALEQGSLADPTLNPVTTIQFLIHNNLVINLY